MMPKNSICAEVGVFRGDFSRDILKIVKPRKLFLIDAWTYSKDYHATNYSNDANQANYNLNYERTKQRMLGKQNVEIIRGRTEETLKSFPNNYFDWIYLDADHRYEFIKKDLEQAFLKVKPLGFITGDDYVDNIEESTKFFGVIKAVTEFKSTHSVRLLKLKSDQYILQKLQKTIPINTGKV